MMWIFVIILGVIFYVPIGVSLGILLFTKIMKEWKDDKKEVVSEEDDDDFL